LHPLTAVEMVVPQLFGDPTWPMGAGGLWTKALNSGREPLIYSTYLGVGLLGLAMLGSAAPRSRRFSTFWVAVALAAFVFALGAYTPIYTTMQRVLPQLGSIRYTSKLVVFVAFA